MWVIHFKPPQTFPDMSPSINGANHHWQDKLLLKFGCLCSKNIFFNRCYTTREYKNAQVNSVVLGGFLVQVTLKKQTPTVFTYTTDTVTIQSWLKFGKLILQSLNSLKLCQFLLCFNMIIIALKASYQDQHQSVFEVKGKRNFVQNKHEWTSNNNVWYVLSKHFTSFPALALHVMFDILHAVKQTHTAAYVHM